MALSSVAMASPTPDSSFQFGQWTLVDANQKRASDRVLLVRESHRLRAQTEACISEVYEQAFGARSLKFPSTLVALIDHNGKPICAAGLRTAREGFFSEVYLDAPIEQALSAKLKTTIARKLVFEVTTLVSRKAEVSSVFVRQLVLLGRRAGFEWSFFTATTRLRKLLHHLRIPLLQLGAADPQRISFPERWGSYYTHSPQVCAVSGHWLDEIRTPCRGVLPSASTV